MQEHQWQHHLGAKSNGKGMDINGNNGNAGGNGAGHEKEPAWMGKYREELQYILPNFVRGLINRFLN